MGRVISIVSGKGGVGKTTITANLGIALSKIGASVVVIDADIGLNNLDMVLGVENKVMYDLVDCINGKCRIVQALVDIDSTDNLFLLPSSRSEDRQKLTEEILNKIIIKLRSNFDYILIDSSAGIGNLFNLATKCADEAIVVVTPHISSVRDADKVINLLKLQHKRNISVLVNRMRGDLVLRKEMLSHEMIESLLKTKIVGIIPESDELSVKNNILEIEEDEQVTRAMEIFARNIFNEKFLIFDYRTKYKGFLGVLRRNIKRNA